MKRYWRTLLITLAALIFIGSFYIKNAVSESSLPQFTFVKESGDDKEIMPVTFAGSFDRAGHFGRSEGLLISNNQIDYNSEQSFVQLFTNGYGNDGEIRELQEKYPSYMRGKWGAASLYEDKDFLVHATIKEEEKSEKKEYSFNISLLDKEKEERTDTKVKILTEKPVLFMGELDVQMVGGMLKVVAVQSLHSYSDVENNEVHIYTIDLSREKIIADELIFKTEQAGSTFINYQKLRETNVRNPNNYFVYEKYELQERTGRNGNKTMDKQGSELMVYNFETGKQQSIPNSKYTGYESFYNDTAIYVIHRKAERLQIETHDINKRQLIKSFEFSIMASQMTEDTKVIIKNSRIYLYSADETYPRKTKQPPGQLIVADLNTGKELYKGQLKAKKGTEMEGILRINYMEIQ
ncbi:hypothetical protein [Bacillus sp. V5-8f]|uniref:hypothetical protein n=1 Tax=Bacillus sp. V5-8f TaxID=2053044 RepID=UPI000C7951AD|nr:hypothetical protein [Bacillus sp. V5-8f]PLT35230.1 hypothetical protein CUU64_07605 [Bacillus sp. V5-8f]